MVISRRECRQVPNKKTPEIKLFSKQHDITFNHDYVDDDEPTLAQTPETIVPKVAFNIQLFSCPSDSVISQSLSSNVNRLEDKKDQYLRSLREVTTRLKMRLEIINQIKVDAAP